MTYFQRYPVDRAYYIAKELLMTERTYKKDLEVITVVRMHCIMPRKAENDPTFPESSILGWLDKNYQVVMH